MHQWIGAGMTPLVSVVMGLYNDGAFVEDAVRSILTQTFTDFEFIIVDDGSVDDSVGRVEKFQDTRIRLIRQPNKGLAEALNVAIKSAVGDYVARQDGDDISVSNRLEQELALFKSQASLGLVGSNTLLMDQDGRLLTQTNLPLSDEKIQKDLMSHSANNPFIHGATMFRRECLLQVGGYRAEFQQAQDIDLWLRIAEKYQLANVQDTLYFWRLRRGAIGERKWESQRDYGRLARQCAQMRRIGQPEPALLLESVRRVATNGCFSRLRGAGVAVEFEMKVGIIFFDTGRITEARSYLFHVVRHNPVYLYAWLLLFLSYFPRALAMNLRSQIRNLYRAQIWNE